MSGLLQPGWRERRVAIGAIALHVVEAGPVSAPTVMLLHGFPEFWWAWRRIIDPLAAAGLRVIVPDMRGYNLSDAPDGVTNYRTEVLADDIAGLATALDLTTFALVGHDWGGLVAWAVAARHPERLDRLVILDAPHPDVWTGYALRHPRQALRSSYVGWFQLPLLPEAALRALDFATLRSSLQTSARPGTFTPAELDRYAEAWRRPGRLTAMLNYYRALPRSSQTIGRIAVPTKILWGQDDGFLDTALAALSRDQCDAGEAVILDATHWLHLEDPDRVAGEIAGFAVG
ncbi:alpha/beta hydrolase [Sphingomonas sp. ID1715]|uniref:alpha/beta fold hydrolase n=1 Tax=Sphingomonas sp. ID1715 TaxID=1656898 RepID=UPI001488B82A|nr:alpha/beta hydrolase [Sphingomonas sp. ID1715]NNM76545.1 alpha/beta hydrolase [Sphingomonas sp. ID1715]